MSFDVYTPYMLTPVTSTSTANGEVLLAASGASAPGAPAYQIYVKYARIIVRSITGGVITLGGDTSSTSPVVLKADNVGEYVVGPLTGIGIPITDQKALTYTATGANLDYSIQVNVHKVRTDLG